MKTFPPGPSASGDSADNAVFTVADGTLWLYQGIDRNSGVRKLQAMKMRGQAPEPGLHTMRITGEGLQVFPRIMRRMQEGQRPDKRLSASERWTQCSGAVSQPGTACW